MACLLIWAENVSDTLMNFLGLFVRCIDQLHLENVLQSCVKNRHFNGSFEKNICNFLTPLRIIVHHKEIILVKHIHLQVHI